MKAIELLKEETRADAHIPQEGKYPSGTTLATGFMKPDSVVVGKPFNVWQNEFYPSFHTSTVEQILSITDDLIRIKTRNSIYSIIIK